jgi:hypothetical protein
MAIWREGQPSDRSIKTSTTNTQSLLSIECPGINDTHVRHMLLQPVCEKEENRTIKGSYLWVSQKIHSASLSEFDTASSVFSDCVLCPPQKKESVSYLFRERDGLTCSPPNLHRGSWLRISHTCTVPSWLATANLSEAWFHETEKLASRETTKKSSVHGNASSKPYLPAIVCINS